MPETGGHCSFIRYFNEKVWWMEERAFNFIKNLKTQTETKPQKPNLIKSLSA